MSDDPRLDLIHNLLTLVKEETSILATQEDADYFRTLWQAKPKQEISSQKIKEVPITKPVFYTKTPVEKPPILEKPAVSIIQTPEKQDIPEQSSLQEDKKAKQVEGQNEMFNKTLFTSFFQKNYPHICIVETPPDDTEAKKIATKWKTKNHISPISILCFQESPEQGALLKNIAIAIDSYFGHAKIIPAESIEKEKQWQAFLESEDLKMIIICDYTLWQLPDLLKHYKETPATQTRSLGKVPLLLLPDLSLYLKDPSLKRSLWKAICNKISL